MISWFLILLCRELHISKRMNFMTWMKCKQITDLNLVPTDFFFNLKKKKKKKSFFLRKYGLKYLNWRDGTKMHRPSYAWLCLYLHLQLSARTQPTITRNRVHWQRHKKQGCSYMKVFFRTRSQTLYLYSIPI